RAPEEDRPARHRQRAEAVDQPLLDVLGQAERGDEPAEGDRLDDDPRHQEVDVLEARGLDRAAEDEHEQQHEHDGLDRVGDQEVGLARDPGQVALGQDERVGGGHRKRAHAATSSVGWASGSSSAAWPVRARKTSSRVGRRIEMSSIPTSTSSRRRTAAAIAPLRGRTGTRTTWSSNVGRSSAIAARAAIARSASSSSSRRTSIRSPPTLSLSSSEVPSAITVPWSITTMWSARRSASSRYCVVSSTVVPAAVRASIVSHIERRLTGSSPVVG